MSHIAQYGDKFVEEFGVVNGGAVTQVIPDFRNASDLLATYDNFSEVDWVNGDFVTLTKYSNGQAVTALSANPLVPGESRVWLNVPVHQPAALEVEASVLDKPIENAATVWTARVSRTAVKPSVHLPLYPRFRVYQPVGMSRPTDKITAISKAGSTTWTVTHTGVTTYAVGNVVGIYGVRDITNFPQTVTNVASIISPTQFTIVGSTGTATSYGGTVSIINGGAAQPGIIAQHAQTVAQVAGQTEWLSVVGNTTWAGVSIGDYVNLHGVRDAAGVDLAIDGAWEVANVLTVTLLLKPITSVLGTRVSPVMPAIGTTPVNCGGSVLLRTTARMHDLMLEDWTETKVMIDGQGTIRSDKALPVSVVNTASSVVSGTTAQDSAAPNPVAIGGRAANANQTAMSAAGDLVHTTHTMIGALVNKPFSIPEADWQYTGTLTTNTSTAMQAAGGAGIKKYCTGFEYQNTSATATVLNILRGTTVIRSVSAAASMANPVPVIFLIPLQTAANEALNVQCVTTGANVLVNAQGYTAP